MVFSSIIFIFYFLPLFLFFYYLMGTRNAVLLLGSVIFYTWGEGFYLLLLISQIGINYWLGHNLAKQQARKRKLRIIAAVALNLIVLGIFKYLGFFGRIASSILQVIGGHDLPDLTLHLPLGISFFTFQLISYQIDVYRGAVKAERSLVRFATYILMFPHLIAGPIVRYADIADELRQRRVDSTKLWLGLQYFIVGLAQKILIANSVSSVADTAFGLPNADLTTAWAWAGVTAYALQIFYDFCGYSNMAIGLAFLLGFHFPKNFNYPYISKSITEYWRRWHISLSTWFRDYVYIPLGGNRGGPVKTFMNLLIVFFLTGLWHGAEWHIIMWAMLHGAAILAERIGLLRILDRLPGFLSWFYCNFLLMIGWVFFRANDLPHAVEYLSIMFQYKAPAIETVPLVLSLNIEVLLAAFFGILLAFPVVPFLQRKFGQVEITTGLIAHDGLAGRVYLLPVLLLFCLFLFSVVLMAASTLNPFLYFRF